MQARSNEVKTVLVADDDSWLREVLVELLDAAGFRPMAARSGPETVRVAREQTPDAIVLDVALPGRSGLRVLEELRTAGSTRHIPVMLVSGEIDLVETGYSREADAAFHKPLDITALLARVEEATHHEPAGTGRWRV